MRLLVYRVKKIFGFKRIRIPVSRTNNLHIKSLNKLMMEQCGPYAKNPVIVSEFVVKSGRPLRYVCHLVNGDEHNVFVRWKKHNPILYYASFLFVPRKKVATGLLVWSKGINEVPKLLFESYVYMDSNDQKIFEALQSFSSHAKNCEEVSQ